MGRNRYRTICTDSETRDWVIAAVPQLDGLWAGANLKTVESGPPAKLVRATVIVAFPWIEPNDMFTIIGTQNSTINTDNWKLYHKGEVRADKQQWNYFK
ncbi:hypothetical protein Bhyg_08933 [Pseudolycoriella hygida]|uniref:DUF4780 domain-containing protein n=1 Tax=Pseudolycoriella hygida TaxID=35572 RepID=A0A9Q0N5J7_9DIPT|nr:hypothetical protein Bhyg_08933 [Pseudolycoriella hygida]